MINQKQHNFLLLAAFCCFFLYRCAPNPKFIRVEPVVSSSSPPAVNNGNATDTVSVDTCIDEPDSLTSDMDFSAAFDSVAGSFEDTCKDTAFETDSTLISLRYPPHRLIKRPVRIALERNISSALFHSDGKIHIKTASKALIDRGKILIHGTKNGRISVSCSSGSFELTLPCTLTAESPLNFIKVNRINYRGLIILVCERKGLFSIVNSIGVEEYLRGVVPLEIGNRSELLIEALKAQAVAARTYTYKSMQERRKSLFDMSATVQDQVYGGADAEFRESDLAIRMTVNLVIVCDDSLIQAYYHSTCGGKTANIEDVWEKPACKYLKSISDTDSSGVPYCSISPRFNWKEQWPSRVFGAQVVQALQKMYPDKVFRGGLNYLTIRDLFNCGRVKTCTFIGHSWKVDIGGDKLRFIIRRYTPEKPILRSANFRIISLSPREVLISGTGYGHGVGMCQMGAVGRAQKGQTFDQILKTYYTGVNICTATE